MASAEAGVRPWHVGASGAVPLERDLLEGGQGRPRPLLERPGRARRVKIVATLGPSTDSLEQVTALLKAGVDCVRLNFSHGTHEEHGRRIALVREAAARLGRPVAIMQDLQGPKIRTGKLVGSGPVMLVPEAELTISTLPMMGDAARVSTTYQHLPQDVRPGDALLLDDGRIRLRALESSDTEVRTRVEVGGLLGENKGINLPGVPVSAPSLTDKDREDLAFGIGLKVDFVALSFVRRAQDILDARQWLEERRADIPLIAKLEKAEAIQCLPAIVAVSDGVMVARGDLGVELGPEMVPILQKRIIRAANQRGILVITATQMLDSMTSNPIPTRAEATDVANAVWDDTDALMLSGETAVGRYPVETVETMARIAVAAEAVQQPTIPRQPARISPSHAISRAAHRLAEDLSVAAIVAFTRTGRTAHLISQDRPRVPVLALTPREEVYRRLALWWGIQPLYCELAEHTDALIEQMEQLVLQRGLARPGQSVVVVGPMPLRRGVHTNFVKVHTVGRRP